MQDNAFIFLEQWKVIAQSWTVMLRVEVFLFPSIPLIYYITAKQSFLLLDVSIFPNLLWGINHAQVGPRLQM